MKVIFSVQKPQIESDLDTHFGRTPFFLLYDLCTNAWETHPNDALDAPEGAGIRAASNVVRLGAQVVVTGHCGPKATEALRKSGLRILDGFSGPLLPILDQIRRLLPEDSR